MKPIDTFILHLFSHSELVRWRTLYHLLKGKRTTSVLTYGLFYNCLQFFSIFPHFKEMKFEKSVHRLVEKGYLSFTDEQFAQITDNGLQYLCSQKSKIDISKINNFLFFKVDQEAWETLQFATQVISELAYGEPTYFPIESSYMKQKQLKKWLINSSYEKKELIACFYQEWFDLLQILPHDSKNRIVMQLTGHDKQGLTLTQVGVEVGSPIFDLFLMQKNDIHIMLQELLDNHKQYPLFSNLLRLQSTGAFSESAYQTYQLFLQGHSLSEIEHIRCLKQSTLVDHLVEACIIDDTFAIERILSSEQFKFLNTYKENNRNVRKWMYNELRDVFPHLSFHEFRMYQVWSVKEGASD